MKEFLINYSPYLIQLFTGIGLATATGFRVFLPLFIVSFASYFNIIDLNTSFGWINELQTLIITGIATIVEIIAYYIPVIDNFLDTLSIPLSTIAGTLIFASQYIDINTFSMAKWALAIIAGGGTAATISSSFAGLRSLSSVGTGTLANPIVSTTENIGSVFISIFSFVIPYLIGAICLVIVILIAVFRKKILKKLV